MVDVVTNRNCVYQTAYHMIWCPKYRRDVLTGTVAEKTGAMLDAICAERGWPVISKEIQPDHIHLFVSIPPAIAVADAIKALKGVTARLLFQKFPALKKRLWGGYLWSPSYYVGTAGNVSAETIRRCIERSGHVTKPKEAEMVLRKGQWFFNLVVETGDIIKPVASGTVLGVDVGENSLAAVSTGKVFGGEHLRDRRDRYLALRRCLQSNGSQSAKQKLRQVSGKEMRRVKHINHETGKAIAQAAIKASVAKITMEDLTHIRERIKTGRRMRCRLHRWAWRQLQTFVEYKAKAAGIAVEYANPAYTSQTCSCCGELGMNRAGIAGGILV